MPNFLPKSLALSGLALLAAAAMPAHAQCVAPANVSGVWTANDGGTYRLHVIGNTIWWVGMSSDDGHSWTNAFRGTRTGNAIAGVWADVRGGIWGHGTLQLRISGTTFIEKTGGAGNFFGGSRWGRGPCNDTAGNPVHE